MKAGTIRFNGADLALYGNPEFTIRKTPEPSPPARCTHRRVEIIVSVHLRADMPATVWKRANALHSLLSSTPEGLLSIVDENGGSVTWMACPGDSGIPQAIARGYGKLDMAFSAIETVAGEKFPLSMTIDPLDGSPEIVISRPTDWSQSVRVARPDDRLGVRNLVANTITFKARTAFADPLDDTGARAAFLMAEAVRLNALQGREVGLVFAGYDGTVQVESFLAQPSSGWEWIDLEAQARSVTLPGDTEAEVSFAVEDALDPATGETRISISGSARANEKSIADAKIEALLAAWRTTGRRVTRILKRDEYHDGEDTDAPEWAGVAFTLELSETPESARGSVEISTRESADGCRTTYSGTATARTLPALILAVESLAGGKHPVEVSSELRVQYAADDQGTQMLVQASFTREYQTAGTVLRGSATRTLNQGSFGDWQAGVSGRISAPTLEQARTAARTFIPSGTILRTDDENEDISVSGTTTITQTQLVTLSFSYAWGTAHTRTSMQYEDTEEPDYTRMVATRGLSGTIWAADRSAAESALAALLTGLSLTNPTKESFSRSHERQVIGSTITDRLLSFRFSKTFETKLTGTIGHDIIEAQFSLQRIGMVDHIPMTEIPLNKPVTQISAGTLATPTGYGYNVGRLTASGSIKARQRATALAWGQAKRSSAAQVSGPHYGAPDAPDERMLETYAPFNGTDITCYQFDFSYPFRYADGLTGLMA
jgi:hypothetical protein